MGALPAKLKEPVARAQMQLVALLQARWSGTYPFVICTSTRLGLSGKLKNLFHPPVSKLCWYKLGGGADIEILDARV